MRSVEKEYLLGNNIANCLEFSYNFGKITWPNVDKFVLLSTKRKKKPKIGFLKY